MTLASVSLWALAAAGIMFIADMWIQHAGQQPPAVLATGERLVYLLGTLGWVASFAAVAAAHRSRQLTAMWRAVRENQLLHRLLRDLEAMSPPALTYPRTGRTPLMLRPHAGLLRTRIECRDRLVTISPAISDELDPADCQRPDRVAQVLAHLHRRGTAQSARPVKPVAILTTGGTGTDELIELARAYAQLAH